MAELHDSPTLLFISHGPPVVVGHASVVGVEGTQTRRSHQDALRRRRPGEGTAHPGPGPASDRRGVREATLAENCHIDLHRPPRPRHVVTLSDFYTIERHSIGGYILAQYRICGEGQASLTQMRIPLSPAGCGQDWSGCADAGAGSCPRLKHERALEPAGRRRSGGLEPPGAVRRYDFRHNRRCTLVPVTTR